MAPEDMDKLKADFARDGYVMLRGVLSRTEIAALHADIDQLMAERGQPSAIVAPGAALTYPSVLKLVEHEKILPVVVNLLGYNIQLHLSMLNIKRPLEAAEGGAYDGGKVGAVKNNAINWHRDGPSPQFLRVPDFSVKVCFILSDLTEPDRGNTKVIPGSHRDPDYQPPRPAADVPLPEEVQICGAPGDAMVFSQNLWHGATYNLSQIERRLAFVAYSACWMRPADYSVAPPELLATASPHLRQLLGDVGGQPYHHYMDGNLPLKDLWMGAEPTSAYAV